MLCISSFIGGRFLVHGDECLRWEWLRYRVVLVLGDLGMRDGDER